MEDWSWYYRSAADRTGEWSAGEYKVMTTGQSPVRLVKLMDSQWNQWAHSRQRLFSLVCNLIAGDCCSKQPDIIGDMPP